jgi:hypothetical protein
MRSTACVSRSVTHGILHSVVVIQYTYSDVHWIYKRISVAMVRDKYTDNEVATWHAARPHKNQQ